MNTPSHDNYPDFLKGLKTRIQEARVKAALAVNRELIFLYWQIGRDVLQRQDSEGWGAKVIDKLARDLRMEFPDMKGFSPRNLKYMRALAKAYSDEQIVLQVVAQIPWGHNQALLNKLEDREQRLWYAQKVIENGWSRNSLEHHIKSDLISRQGKAITNFSLTLPEVQSDLAQDLLKSEYNLEFIDLKEKALEREIEQALVSHIQKFLLELGVGFAFVGRQHRLEVEGDEFFIDLLFYHVQLRCYVVIELKTAEFRPEFSGQINFYVNVVDDQLKHPDDQPTIGLVLCRSRKKSIVHYALRGMSQPIGVSTYELGKALPSVEQLEHEIESASVEFEKTEQ